MANDVAVAKQNGDKNFCTIDDVQRMGEETTYWSVDDDGEPVDYLDHTESDFYKVQYVCTCCMDDFNSWDEVKAHLSE